LGGHRGSKDSVFNFKLASGLQNTPAFGIIEKSSVKKIQIRLCTKYFLTPLSPLSKDNDEHAGDNRKTAQ
jgi:hypothetical protein